MKLLNIAFSFLMLLGVVACDPMSDYSDELDRLRDADNAYKSHISTRSPLSEDNYIDAPFVLSAEDYDRNDETAGFDNFSSYAPVDEYMPLILDVYYSNPGEVIPVQYNYYDGTTTTTDNIAYATFIKEDLAWQIVPNYLMVKTDDTNNNKSYTVTATDYTMVGEGYPNFDLRNNSEEQIIEKLNIILKTNKLLELNKGDIWEMTFATYSLHDDGSVTESPLYLEVTVVE